MAMTFVNMQDSILEHIGDLHSSTRTKVKRWINDARNEVWEALPGIYKEKTDYLTTSIAYTTGTLSVALAGTAVTGVGTAWDSTWGKRWILIGGTQPWYEIASIADTTNLTLADGALAAATTSTYKLDTYMWTMESDVQQLLQVTLENDELVRDLPISNRTDVLSEMARPLEWDSGTPRTCWIDEKDANGVYHLAIWPKPSVATLVRYRYEQNLTELTTDSQEMGIHGGDPAIRARAMVEAMIFAGKPQNATLYWGQFSKAFDTLLQTVPRSRGTTWRRRDPTDAVTTGVIVNMGSKWPRPN